MHPGHTLVAWHIVTRERREDGYHLFSLEGEPVVAQSLVEPAHVRSLLLRKEREEVVVDRASALAYNLSGHEQGLGQLLVDRGAQVNMKNKRGQTPLAALMAARGQTARVADSARQVARQSTVDLLQKLGAVE